MLKTKTSELNAIVLICLLGVGLTLPAFYSDFYTGHNVLTHLMWSRHFAEQFWGGDLYPRWLMNMNDGLGSPAFFFYFPFPYYITSLFHAPFLPLPADGWLQLGLASSLAFTSSGVFCYLWLKSTFGSRAATLGTVVYMLLPYHLLVDLFYRFAYTEFWAFAFMPLCLLGVERIRQGARFGLTATATSYALLFLTHLPTVLIFTPVLLVYMAVISPTGKRSGHVLRLAIGLGLGAGLAAFYWVPAILNQTHVTFAAMTQGEFRFENNFLFSLLKSHPKKSELGSYHSFVTFSTLFTLAIGLVSWLLARRAPGVGKAARVFWFVVGAGAFFMMIEISAWLWHLLPGLSRIQFPYRFNLLLALSVAFLSAAAMESSTRIAATWLNKAWTIAMAAFLVSQTIIAGITIHQGLSSRWAPEIRKEIEQELALSPEVLEYTPRWAKTELFPVTLGAPLMADIPSVEISSGDGRCSVITWRLGRIVLRSDAATPLTAVVKHLYYPNWRAKFGSEGRPVKVFPSAELGFIGLEIPAGNHEVILSLGIEPKERCGLAVSAMSLLIVSILAWRACREKP